MNLENELKAALRRQNPPPGFATRVIARSQPRRRAPLMAWAGAMAAMLVGGIAIHHEYQERSSREGQGAGHPRAAHYRGEVEPRAGEGIENQRSGREELNT